MKKIISYAVASCILLSTAAMTISCSDRSGNTVAETTATPVALDTELIDLSMLTEYERRQLISDNLPDRKFDGAKFRVAVEMNKEFEIYAEELTGEITNDAVYNRNLKIEDRLDIRIQHEILTEVQTQINTLVIAGDDAFEIMGYQAYWSHIPIAAKSAQNWYDIPYMDFTKPWYNNRTNEAATFNGKLFNLTSSLAVTQMQYTYAMFFNQRITEEFGCAPTDLYQLVYNNEWTFDKFNEIVSGIYIDVNGNAKKDLDDVFGYACQLTHPSDVWLAAFDQPVTGKNADGKVIIELNTEKTISALQKIYDLTYSTESTFTYTNQYDEYKYFANAKVAICPLPFKVAYNELRAMEDGYGILPYPKWDSNQEQYLTNIFDQYSAFVVPKTASDLDFIGIIMEALNAESYKTVYPAFYDVALKGKYTEDEDTARMVDIVMEGANMDLSFMFGTTLSELPYLFRNLIADKSTDFASKYKGMEKALRKSLEKMHGYYEE